LFVVGVPSILSEKLLTRDELHDLVKGFIVHFQSVGAEHPTNLVSQDSDFTTFTWQRALRWCPKELIDLINSKACRGAIMFNDTLTQEQCEELVLQLSKTDMPFQCAHGRPSLVPLTSFSENQNSPGESSRLPKLDGFAWSQFLAS